LRTATPLARKLQGRKTQLAVPLFGDRTNDRLLLVKPKSLSRVQTVTTPDIRIEGSFPGLSVASGASGASGDTCSPTSQEVPGGNTS
jgi:hypothetical protein